MLMNEACLNEACLTCNIQRYYSGDGREGKRAKQIFNGNPGYWQDLGATYYVRSSVLNGEVISEVDSTGKKVKTHVYASGSKLAVQSEYTYNSTTTESVEFEHFDASGMSYRRSLSNGIGVVGAGDYEGTPGEFDPLGGNAGLTTPYVEEPEPLPDPGPLSPIFPFYTDAPMMCGGRSGV